MLYSNVIALNIFYLPGCEKSNSYYNWAADIGKLNFITVLKVKVKVFAYKFYVQTNVLLQNISLPPSFKVSERYFASCFKHLNLVSVKEMV